jgi:EAL domain-containing protein (putative c-di-GMP-specific phosphodiesterase class I)
VLEVPQEAVAEDLDRTVAVLERVHALGVRLALDGFGAGRSTFGDLRRLPLDEVKLDASCVRGMGRDAADAAVVRATAQLARTLGVRVVAEGVEDAAARAELAALGCDALQGPVLGPPLAPDDVPAWAAARPRPAALPRAA